MSLSPTTRFRAGLQPMANPAATVLGPHVRFTVLTPRLLRLEYDPTDRFEDRPSQVFLDRQQPAPAFEVKRSAEQIEIITDGLHLRYAITPKGFHRRSLSVRVRSIDTTWRYGDTDWQNNLRGTARTLDDVRGSARLEMGLMSRSGWAVVDDSKSLLFDERGWLAPRRSQDAVDLYFFGYGHDYLGCLRDFTRIAGPMPLIPRWMLGNWWSRYWAYSQAELQGLMEEFRSHDIPLSVCIVDMDWHVTDTGNASRGWTGYTWNRGLFPDPAAFLAWLHEHGLRTSLNLHPADGVWPHEEQYAAMARRLGMDPAAEEPIPFDLAEPAFADAYFELLHHPQEAMGVDFWWIDWQQGAFSKLPGLDPLWWLNHLHFLDLGRQEPGELGESLASRRPVIFSRWGGLGNHRYPIGFSGDTVVSWESLAFQPAFTAKAANVGYGWWSHDIGGHMGGVEEAELYVRWVQYGVFSPILRLHCTKNPYHERRPWGWDAETARVAAQAMQLRHALIPYLYSMAWRCATDSRPLCLPMYYLQPEADDAYACSQQYAFGSELVAAPFVAPADADTRLSRQDVWLPAGAWFDFFSGERLAGGRWHTIYGGLEDIPVYAKAGAIVPMGPRSGRDGVANPTELSLAVFPGADNRFALYEDDGETQAYRAGRACVTSIAQAWRGHSLEITVEPAQGDLGLVPALRRYTLVLRGIVQPATLRIAVDGVERNPQVEPFDASYDVSTETLTLSGIELRPVETLTVMCASGGGSLLAPRDRRVEKSRRLLRAFHLDSWVKLEIDRGLPDLAAGRASLRRHYRDLKDAQVHALCSVLDVCE